jgi:hypothetical protein
MDGTGREIIGKRFRFLCGNYCVVVTKRQKKQTIGWFIGNTRLSSLNQLRDVIEDTRKYNAVDLLYGFDEENFKHISDETPCLCLESELDEQENEFGLIMP